MIKLPFWIKNLSLYCALLPIAGQLYAHEQPHTNAEIPAKSANSTTSPKVKKIDSPLNIYKRIQAAKKGQLHHLLSKAKLPLDPSKTQAPPPSSSLADDLSNLPPSWYRSLVEPVRYSRLGNGSFGIVHCVVDHFGRNPEEKIAIKALRKSSKNNDTIDMFKRESQGLANCLHPYIPRYIGQFEDGLNLYLAMEYIDGDSLEFIIKQGNVQPIGKQASVEDLLFYFTQVCLALDYLHGFDIAHRDIKPANIMVGKNHITKLIDFGLSKLPNDPQGETAGTLEYMAPEVICGLNTSKSDVFSAGVVLQVILSRHQPTVFRNNSNGYDRQLAPLPAHIDSRLSFLIRDMTNNDPNMRPTMPMVLHALEKIGSYCTKIKNHLQNDKNSDPIWSEILNLQLQMIFPKQTLPL